MEQMYVHISTHYALVHSINTIQYAYRALLAQAIDVSLQHARKTGEVKPNNAVLMLMFKLHKKMNELHISYEVIFLFSSLTMIRKN